MMDWVELYEPISADTITNAWSVAIDPQGNFLGGEGENAYGEGWYYYPEFSWWNIWFADHTFDTTR